MQRLAITDAQERLDQLVERAAEGEDIVITREGMPVATITRYMPGHGRFGRPEDADTNTQFSEDYIG